MWLWRGKKLTFPIGARCVLVGDWSVEVLRKGRSGVNRMKGVEGKVGLKVPVLYDGREKWVRVRAFSWEMETDKGKVKLERPVSHTRES